MLKVDFDTGPLLAKLDGIEEKLKAAIRPVAFAGSDVIYKEVRHRALGIGGSQRLQDSIYQKFVIDSKGGVLGESATYHISWRKGREKSSDTATKGASLPYTTIGFWIEFGRWQRYMARTDETGDWYTVKRPNAKGKPPGRKATQEQKDAYWMPRKDGPVFHPPKSFLRSGYDAAKDKAVQAAKDRMRELLTEALR